MGRAPTVADLAWYLKVEPGEVDEALAAADAYAPRSLSAPVRTNDGEQLQDRIGGPDAALDLVDLRESVGPAMAALSEREQRILIMRFYGNLTQAQIGARLGISQMHVSRLLARALHHLRGALEGN